ncbi:MAG TPA: hypothetical protein VMD99_02415 [Terriglobales bacterium]|nr:hypothetical protein [Terriglobales bacterium]
MSSSKSNFRLMGAIAALAALAFAVSCQGFFPPATYTSIAIEPTPQIPLSSTQGLEVWGTDSATDTTAQITSGVDWSVGTGSTGNATITDTGVATGTAIGSITVNAEYEGLTTSATGVVYLANISSICLSTDNTSGSCSASQETISSSEGGQVNLYAIADYTNSNSQTLQDDITTSATFTVSGPDTTDVTCTNTSSPASCVVTGGSVTTTGTYTITVTYPQTAITATNTIIVD